MLAAPLPTGFALETDPEHYRHWKVTIEPPIATLAMDVREDAGISQEYRLKLNSYDLGVDVELADAVLRLRFEHPEVHAVVITSLKPRVFCAGANIHMLRGAAHADKVNFCKFTNETRLAIEDASLHSGIRFVAALNGMCAGGGYELALACDEILLTDDGSSAVSLPEAPLLGVLPGTGGLTRMLDKRRVRRDLADVFSTLVEGVRGRRAVEWRLVDAVYPPSRFRSAVITHARRLAALSDRPPGGPGVHLTRIAPEISDTELRYRHLTLAIDRSARVAALTIMGPSVDEPIALESIVAAGDAFWPLRLFRELDDALLRLRFGEPEVGVVVLRTRGETDAVLRVDAALADHADHWLVREITLLIKRTLKRLDLTARSFFAFIEPGSCFAGTLFELALAADRSYMLDDPDQPTRIVLSPMNAGPLPASNGLSRLEARFLADPGRVQSVLSRGAAFDPQAASDAGLVSFAPDDLDWDDEVRQAVEARVALSPDALTGLEANLRFPGPETLETKIFGRLTAWQNWIFQRPNAVGDRGALTVYGSESRPTFDWRRT